MRLFPVLLLAALACGQVQPGQVQPGQPAEAPKKARIEGLVVSLAGGPVARAAVRLQGQTTVTNGTATPGGSYSATAGDDGKFVIDDIDPGRNFILTAQRTGFVTGRYGARSSNTAGAQLILDSGASLKGLTITLTPQGVISGHVTDALGDPVQSVIVSLMRRGYQRGVRQLVAANSASTNDQGEFRIAGLQPGRYYVMASGRSLNDAVGGTASSGTTSVPTYYPNGVDPQSAAPFDIVAGQEMRNVDIRLRQGKAYSVKGKFLNAQGTPIANASVITMPKTGATDAITVLTLRNQANTRQDGSFELRGLTPGLYALQAITPNAAAARTMGRADVNIADADVTNLVLTANPGATIRGTVRAEDGDLKSLLPATPAGGAQPTAALVVAATAAGVAITGARLTIALTEATPQPLASAQPAQVNDDGTFVIENIQPSKFLLNVAGLPQGTYVKSAQYGGTDVTRNEIDLTSGGGGSLEIVLSKKAGDVAGVITPQKDESVAGMMVTLWTRDPEPGNPNNGIRNATTDQNGNFQFQGLRPGVYYAAAWEDIEAGLWQARDFLNAVGSDATKIEVAEGGHSSAQVKVVPIAKIKAAEEKLP
jgi:hypothetical protein